MHLVFLIEMPIKSVSKGLIDHKSALVQIRAWCQFKSHYQNQWWATETFNNISDHRWTFRRRDASGFRWHVSDVIKLSPRPRSQVRIVPDAYAPLRCHQMETFSALLAICTGNSPVTGEFPPQRPVTPSFDVFFDLRLNKRLSNSVVSVWFPKCQSGILEWIEQNYKGAPNPKN